MLFKEDEIARAEAHAVRTNAAWYRWTHDLVTVTGEDAEKFLDWILVNTIAGLPVGRGKYTTMLDEDGRIIDDLVVFHKEEGLWWLSTLYGPHALRWFDKHADGFKVTYEDITQQIDMYAIQGPNATKIVNELVEGSVDDLKRFHIIDTTVDTTAGCLAVTVDRGGFTGELGYEIYCAREDSAALAEAIGVAAAKYNAPQCKTLEVYVRSLPMEKGMALRQDYKGLTPFEANLGWSVHLDKDFFGKEALEKAQEDTPQRAFVGIEIERDSYEDIAQNEIIRKRGVPIGICRQMIYGYTVDKNIGFGIVDAAKAPLGTRITIGPNDSPGIIVEPKWC